MLFKSKSKSEAAEEIEEEPVTPEPEKLESVSSSQTESVVEVVKEEEKVEETPEKDEGMAGELLQKDEEVEEEKVEEKEEVEVEKPRKGLFSRKKKEEKEEEEKVEEKREEKEEGKADELLPKEEVEEEKKEEEEAEEEKPKKEKKGKEKEVYEPEPYDADKHGALVVFEGVPNYEEVERYWVDRPYAFVVILYNEDENDRIYHVCEPKLTPFENLFLNEMKSRLQDALMTTRFEEGTSKEEVITQKLNEIILDYDIKITTPSYYKIRYYIVRDFVKVDKLTPLMSDSMIEDVSCNGWNSPIFLYHKNYQNIQTNVVFAEDDLTAFVIRLAQRAGKHISVANPLVDATMPDGSRIQMTLGDEVTTKGTTFTIRKFKDVPATPVDLIKWNAFSSQMMAYLWLCIENNKSLIFSGGTASGKTTSLNAVSLFIPPKAKVISLEDTRELQLPHKNWIPGLTRESFTPDGTGSIDMYELLRAALRQRPEYLLVGEVRGKEALTLFQAMSTGHTTYSTMHADSIDRVIHRLENPPISVPRTMIEALDIVSVQAQTYTAAGKRVRRCIALVEISEIDPVTKILKTVDIFKWDPSTDTFPEVGISQSLEEIRLRRAWSPQELQRQLRQRQRVLEYLVENKINDFKSVATMIHTFQARPDKVIKIVGEV